jgi:hypothetical protein
MLSWGMDRMEPGIAQSIAVALASRRLQQEPTGRLLIAWTDLARNVDALIAAVEEAHGQFSHDRQIPGARSIAGELGRWRGANDLRVLPDKVATQMEGVTAIRDRALRTTVNIGVVGQTGSGKSTFLQKITNLSADVIPPANGPKPTTAARSRFMHSRDRAEAEIKLLTWTEFREKYTAPLHKRAGCPGEAPLTREAFLRYKYKERLETSRERQDSEAGVSPQALLRRLIVAQDSFYSYEPLLGAGLRPERLENLRPYVAYPQRDKDMNRPYHAVRDVLVHHRFVVDIENLVFVDLPGTGETGLEVDQQFLADLKSEIDVLLHILRPLAGRGRLGKADDEILDLADHVKMGRDRADFICMVINEDYEHNTSLDVIHNVWSEAEEYARVNGFMLVRGDAAKQEEARDKILLPVLRHLAHKLATMDEAIAGHVAKSAKDVAEDTAEVVGRLEADIGRWQVDVPPEEEELAKKAKDLRDKVAKALKDLSGQYASRAQAKEPVPEVVEGITQAKRRLAEWAREEFGAPGRSAWLEEFENKLAGDPGEAKDDACTVVRQKLRHEFGQVDSSLAAAKRRVHGEITGVLRQHLRTTLVPEDDESFSVLLNATGGPGFNKLHSALKELVAFRTGYGSIFLRVGRPVVAQITREEAEASRARPTTGPTDQQRGRPSLKQPSALFDGTRGRGPGPRAPIAASQPHAVITAAAFALTLAAATKVGEAIGPKVAEWLWPTAVTDSSAESFRKALSDAFDRAVELIAEQIRSEANQLTEALAAIVDEFYDGFTHVPMIEYEYKELCRPYRRELWPGTFDGGAAELSEGLGRLAKAVKDTAAAARSATDVVASIGTTR